IGSHAVTPLTVATGYAVFANGGHSVRPHLIQRIVNFNDGEVYQARPATVCSVACQASTSVDANSLSTLAGSASLPETPGQESLPPAPRVIDERVAYIMNSILRSVITEGSG